jgi:hypothetical protein
LWFTVLKDVTYTDWFHLAKVYSSTAGCIGFWCIRHVTLTNKKTGKEWKLADQKWALWFPPLILSINIIEAVARDFQVGMQYWGGGISPSQMISDDYKMACPRKRFKRRSPGQCLTRVSMD